MCLSLLQPICSKYCYCSMSTASVTHKSIAAFDTLQFFHSASNACVLYYSSKHKRDSIKGISILSFCFAADYCWRTTEQCGDTEAAAWHTLCYYCVINVCRWWRGTNDRTRQNQWVTSLGLLIRYKAILKYCFSEKLRKLSCGEIHPVCICHLSFGSFQVSEVRTPVSLLAVEKPWTTAFDWMPSFYSWEKP